jgi:hypothetical protein
LNQNLAGERIIRYESRFIDKIVEDVLNKVKPHSLECCHTPNRNRILVLKEMKALLNLGKT